MDNLKSMLSVKTICIVAFVVLAPFSLYLLPGNAQTFESLQEKKTQLDLQKADLAKQYDVLNTQLEKFATLKTSVETDKVVAKK